MNKAMLHLLLDGNPRMEWLYVNSVWFKTGIDKLVLFLDDRGIDLTKNYEVEFVRDVLVEAIAAWSGQKHQEYENALQGAVSAAGPENISTTQGEDAE